uniref:Uncharacterized protein n=1 Tax=Caenorhabditis japonica TaxID=281687 RepID=A0A8R1IGW9_CAEJA
MYTATDAFVAGLINIIFALRPSDFVVGPKKAPFSLTKSPFGCTNTLEMSALTELIAPTCDAIAGATHSIGTGMN